MTSYLNIIPEELSQYIVSLYFKNYIFPKIQNKNCHTTVYLNQEHTKKIKCNMKPVEGAFCMFCHCQTIEYY